MFNVKLLIDLIFNY